MQIILSHFDEVSLTTQSKKANSAIIEKLTGVKAYNGHKDQITEICNKIRQSSYPKMKGRLRKDHYDDTEPGTSNAVSFMEFFETSDASWIKELRY